MSISKNFLMRTTESICLIALFLSAIFFAYTPPLGTGLFALLLIGFAGGACWELSMLLAKKQLRPYTLLLLIGGSGYLALHVATLFSSNAPSFLWLLLLVSFLARILLKSTKEVLAPLAATLFCFVYVYIPTQFLFDLTFLPQNRWWLIWTLLIIKGSDIAAYIAGKTIGKRLLTPISPKKTWEGFHAGWIGGALCSFFMGYAPGAPTLSSLVLVLMGAFLAICGIVGDLIESRFKREVDIKDSNSFIPGLGGFLDMADSLLFAAPFAYFCFKMVG